MKKIPTMFDRDSKTFRVINKVKPECQWVIDGEGIATFKWDGTCCMVKDMVLFKRYDGSKSKFLPPDFVAADDADSHWLGWRPVGSGPEDRWFSEAWSKLPTPLVNGTYELVGPKINKNEDHLLEHCFKAHGDVQINDVPRTFDGLRDWLAGKDMEGIVFHHPDGRMAKIKLKDFGLRRTVKAQYAPNS